MTRCGQASPAQWGEAQQAALVLGYANANVADTHSPDMNPRLLLTSFTTWKPEQPSNASDDLLHWFIQQHPTESLHFLRQLPVDFDLAPQTAIAHLTQLQPDGILCCGMAESRQRLTVESQAVKGDRILKTSLNLELLIEDLSFTDISHDAGDFVCNRLYFDTLEHLQNQGSECFCLFLHVPMLTAENQAFVQADFYAILEKLGYKHWFAP